MDSMNELASLADTAGAVVTGRMLQERRHIHPSTFLGKGKVHQLAGEVTENDIDTVIFDEDLSPVQMKNLEMLIKRKIVDRSGLILDIFARRARTREAQTQVELAQLQYLLPRLTRQWTHLSRQVGGIGTRGPGETQLEVDRRIIRKRINRLQRELDKIETQRSVRRKRRWEYKKLALVGYTNAGKSSLLNALARTDVFVENRLFATLDATIRTVPLDTHQKVLLIDTVGFIRKLPHHLVASFRSTLEETVEADILLHVVDVSHPNYSEHIGSVQNVLRELGIIRKPTVMVLNKVDRLDERQHMAELRQRYQPAVFTSAVKGIGLESLRQAILDILSRENIEMEVRIRASETRIISLLYKMTTVIEKKYEDDHTILKIRTSEMTIKRIGEMTGEDRLQIQRTGPMLHPPGAMYENTDL